MVGELAGKGAEFATVGAVAKSIASHDVVAPEFQTTNRVKSLQALALPRQHLMCLQRDHLLHERFFVDEVAVELRLAGSARYANVVKRRGGDAPGVHESGCRAHDPVTSRQATPRKTAGLRELVFSAGHGRHPRTGNPLAIRLWTFWSHRSNS